MVTRTLLILLLAASPAAALDDSTPNSRAKAALALTTAKAATCGKCRDDLNACRKDSLKTGKPLVVVVNHDCGGLAKKMPTAIFCRVPAYEGDGQAKTNTPRTVVLTPDAKDQSFLIRGSLPASANLDDVKKALKPAAPAPAQPLPNPPLNWVIAPPALYPACRTT